MRSTAKDAGNSCRTTCWPRSSFCPLFRVAVTGQWVSALAKGVHAHSLARPKLSHSCRCASHPAGAAEVDPWKVNDGVQRRGGRWLGSWVRFLSGSGGCPRYAPGASFATPVETLNRLCRSGFRMAPVPYGRFFAYGTRTLVSGFRTAAIHPYFYFATCAAKGATDVCRGPNMSTHNARD